MKGIGRLKIGKGEYMFNNSFPFSIVASDQLPYCCILGINFLKLNRFTIDFGENSVGCENGEDEWNYPLKIFNRDSDEEVEFIGSVMIDIGEGEEEISEDDCEDTEEEEPNVRFNICNGDIQLLKKKDHTIKSLVSKLIRNIPHIQWKE